jgi:hypothetical protein
LVGRYPTNYLMGRSPIPRHVHRHPRARLSAKGRSRTPHLWRFIPQFPGVIRLLGVGWPRVTEPYARPTDGYGPRLAWLSLTPIAVRSGRINRSHAWGCTAAEDFWGLGPWLDLSIQGSRPSSCAPGWRPFHHPFGSFAPLWSGRSRRLNRGIINYSTLSYKFNQLSAERPIARVSEAWNYVAPAVQLFVDGYCEDLCFLKCCE